MVYRIIVPLHPSHRCDGDYAELYHTKEAIWDLLVDDKVPTFILVKLGEQHDRK